MYNVTNNSSTVQSNFDYSSLNQKQVVAKSDMEQQQDRFMKLLVKQLQSQDPMNPMDNAQMTSQMAQINTVTGIEKLNQTMNQLLATFGVSQAAQASSVIGREVMAPGSSMVFDGKTAQEIRLNLTSPADDVRVSIVNAQGVVVEEQRQSAAQAGQTAFTWDGKLADGSLAPAGQYRVVARGIVGGKDVALDTMTWQKAGSVEFGASGVKVVLADGSAVDFGKVTKIR